MNSEYNRGNYGRDGGRDGGREGYRDGGRGRGAGHRERRGIPLSELDPALTSISHKVIGCARDVHMSLGSGYSEAVYLEALKNELTAQGVPFKMAHAIPVKYKEAVVGQTIADLYIATEHPFVVEVMAEPREVSSGDRSGLRAQLKAADLTLGLIINFAGRLLKDGLVRVLNVDKINRERGVVDEGGEDDDTGTVDFDQ